MYVQHELTKGLLISNDGHCEAFRNGSNEHFQDQQLQQVIVYILFCICGPFFFHLLLLIHNNKLYKHPKANNKINLTNRTTRANRKCRT